jgi:hypothetical protein
MNNAVERLGRGGAGTQQRRKFLEKFLYLGRESGDGGSGLGALVLALVRVRPEAACRTCCFAGIIESSNFARKSKPMMGVATAARKKSNSKSWPAKETNWRRQPQVGTSLPLAPTRCGPVDSAQLECGRIEIDATESTKNFRFLLES